MSNHISSINSLINQDTNEDEDRKFLRAAAEAIVATSMNNQIDPTILELLKRIQYAAVPNNNSSSTVNNNNGRNNDDGTIHLNNDFSFMNGGDGNTVQPNKNHFPAFNLNYFENLSNNHGANNNNNDSHDPHSTSSWNFASSSSHLNHDNNNNNNSNNSPINHNSNNSIRTPLSITSTITTPPSISNQNSATNTSSSGSSFLNDPEKPFICTDCSLSFRRSSDLRRHQRAHLPILPHICQLCGKGFARKDALKRHSDTLTCKRNREKLLGSGGDIDSILERAGVKRNSQSH